MTPFPLSPRLFASTALLALCASGAAEAACSRADIDYYLQRGFTHDQVVRLCGAPAPRATTDNDAAAPPVQAPVASTPTPPAGAPRSDDIVYLQTVLDADAVEVTPEALSWSRERCFPYGEENAIGFREQACGKMITTIQRKGLEIVEAIDPVFLVRDGKLILKGDISRAMTFKRALHPREQRLFFQDYPSHPAAVALPLRKGHKPTEAAKRIQPLGQ